MIPTYCLCRLWERSLEHCSEFIDFFPFPFANQSDSRKYPDACVIYVDAHADINTPQTTGSGNIHGMPLSFILGLDRSIPEFQWINRILPANKLVYIGLRDLDESEKEIIRNYGIKAFSMHEVDEYGIGKVVQMALDHVNPNRDLPIHMSFDIDALDPSVAPSTGVPVDRGLTSREGHYICEAVHKTGCLVALDLVVCTPFLISLPTGLGSLM